MRRTFVELREVPGLITAVTLGDAAAMRRVLGARRAGRIGALLCAALLALASATALDFGVGLAAYAALASAAALRHRDECSAKQCFRLMLWTAPAPLLLAIVARALGAGSAIGVLLAAAGAFLLLDGGLRAGMRD